MSISKRVIIPAHYTEIQRRAARWQALWDLAVECLAHTPPQEYNVPAIAAHVAPLIDRDKRGGQIAPLILTICKRAARWDLLLEVLTRVGDASGAVLVATAVREVEGIETLLGDLMQRAESSPLFVPLLACAHEAASEPPSSRAVKFTPQLLGTASDGLVLRLAEWPGDPKDLRAPAATPCAGAALRFLARMESLRREWSAQMQRTALRPISDAQLREFRQTPPEWILAFLAYWDAKQADAMLSARDVGFLLQLVRAGMIGHGRGERLVEDLQRALTRAQSEANQEAGVLGLRNGDGLRVRLAANLALTYRALQSVLQDEVSLRAALNAVPGDDWPRARAWLNDEARHIWGDRMPELLRTALDQLCQRARPRGLKRMARWGIRGKQEKGQP